MGMPPDRKVKKAVDRLLRSHGIDPSRIFKKDRTTKELVLCMPGGRATELTFTLLLSIVRLKEWPEHVRTALEQAVLCEYRASAAVQAPTNELLGHFLDEYVLNRYFATRIENVKATLANMMLGSFRKTRCCPSDTPMSFIFKSSNCG